MEDKIGKLISVCRLIDTRPEYFQGGGGNVSVKLNERTMVVKASGFKLSEINRGRGLVEVNYQTVGNFYRSLDFGRLPFFERQSANVILSAVIAGAGQERLRPSLETGFHALLGKYVIHSHSVYANFLFTCVRPDKLINRIFLNSGAHFIIADYSPPGFYLTLEVLRKIGSQKISPKVIFLKNHGLIVSAGTADAALAIHEKINEAIKLYFRINTPYPAISVNCLEQNRYSSGTRYLIDFFRNNKKYFSGLKRYMLFPDQIVFCLDAVIGESSKNMTNKIVFDIEREMIIYNGNFAEALTMKEVLTSWAFIMSNLKNYGLTPSYISKKEADFVSCMESERYRKNLIKK